MTTNIEILNEVVRKVLFLCPPLGNKKIFDIDTLKLRKLVPSDDQYLYIILKSIIRKEYKERIKNNANVSIFE